MSTTNNEVRPDTLLTIDQASDRLSISKSLLRSELLKHRLKVVRMGRRLFIPRESCDELIRLGLRPFNPHRRGAG
jgi:excisionase family DNA binding protein